MPPAAGPAAGVGPGKCRRRSWAPERDSVSSSHSTLLKLHMCDNYYENNEYVTIYRIPDEAAEEGNDPIREGNVEMRTWQRCHPRRQR